MKSWVFVFSGHKNRLGGAEISSKILADNTKNIEIYLINDPKNISTVNFYELLTSCGVNFQFFGLKAVLLSLLIPSCNRRNRFLAIRGSDLDRPVWKSLIYVCFRPFCRGWISNSRRAIADWNRRCEIHLDKVHLVRNLNIDKKGKRILGLRQFVYRLVVVSNEKYGKGLESISDLIGNLKIRGVRIVVDVFGVTTEKIINDQTEYINDQLFMRGWSDNIYDELCNYDAILSLSRSEGLPQAITHAVDVGLPVFALDSGDISDIVINGINGFAVLNFDELENKLVGFYKKKFILKRRSLPLDFTEEHILNMWRDLSI